MGNTMQNYDDENMQSKEYVSSRSTNLPVSLSQMNDANQNYSIADNLCDTPGTELQDEMNNLSRKADRSKISSRKSAGCVSEALTDTDSYLTADDEMTSSSDEEELDDLSKTLQERQFFGNTISISSAYEHVEEIMFYDGKTVNGQTYIDEQGEVFVELREQKKATSLSTLGVDSEPRRRSYQYAIEDFSDMNNCRAGDQIDGDNENEAEIPYDLDPAEFNHRTFIERTPTCSASDSNCSQSEYLLGLDPVEFRHPRRETERHESVVEGSRLSTVVLHSELHKPATVTQVDHGERIIVRSAARFKLILPTDDTHAYEDRVNVAKVPVSDRGELSDSGTSSSQVDIDEQISETEDWQCIERPIVEATVCETMEIIRATLVESLDFSEDGYAACRGANEFESSQVDLAVGDTTEIPVPDYSPAVSEDESCHSDTIINVQRAVNENFIKSDYSVPSTPEPDYDVVSPASPTENSSGEFPSTLAEQSEVSQNVFSFENTEHSNAIEYEDEDNELAIQTPLDRRGTTRKSLYKRRPSAPPKTRSISTLPKLEDEERVGMEQYAVTDADEITHFGIDACSQRTVDESIQSGIPSRYDTGPAAVPIVLSRQEREFLSRPLVGPGVADLTGVPLTNIEGVRTRLDELAMPVQKKSKSKRHKPATKTIEAGGAELMIHQLRTVTLRREQSGFGMTIRGSSPVQIVGVSENSAAMKAQVLVGDKIIKRAKRWSNLKLELIREELVNGTFVTSLGQDQVNELIKGAGSFVKLDLLPRNDIAVQQDVPAWQEGFHRRATMPVNSSWSQERVMNRSFSPDTGHVSPTMDETPQEGSAIMAMESDEEDEDHQKYQTTELANRAEFGSMEMLMQKPAHMAVFISFVLSHQRNSASLLFSLIVQRYGGGNNAKETVRWAQEIFSTFLAESAPLRIPVDSELISLVENTIGQNRLEKETELFKPMLRLIKAELESALSEFRQARSLGFQAMYGGELLKGNMDRQDEMKVIESALWQHFLNYYRDEADQSQAVAIVLATYFKQVGFNPEIRNSSIFELCPTFNTKDKKAFWLKAKKTVQGHQFGALNSFTTSHCMQCSNVIWNAFIGGFQCSNCQSSVHKSCVDKLRNPCSGPKGGRDKTRAKTIINMMPHKITTVLPSSFTGSERHVDPKASDDSGISSDGRSLRTPSVLTSPQSFSDLQSSSSFSSLSSRQSLNSICVRDPDLIIEPELPLKAIIPKEKLSKLKSNEEKQQQIIHELFYLERKHVSILKMMLFIYRRMSEESWIQQDFVRRLFPGIEELVEVHVAFSNDCKARVKESEVVHNVADILLKQFSGERGDHFAKVCSMFIRDQKFVLNELRSKLAKDLRLASFLQELCSDALFQRMELKDFIPQEMQRITRYPMLVDRLIRSTPANTEEHRQLMQVMPLIEKVAMKVNEAANECENSRKAHDMDRKLDRRASDLSILTEFKNQLQFGRRKLIRDGDLTWKLGSGKQVIVHVALFADVIVLLQSQEDRLVLRSQNVTIGGKEKVPHSPVIRLNGLMARENAAEKRVFFLICFNKSQKLAQNYTLSASSTEEKSSWLRDINKAISGQLQQSTATKSNNVIQMMTNSSPFDTTDAVLDTSASLDMLDSCVDGSHVVDAVEISSVEVEHLVNTSVMSEECVSPDSEERSLGRELDSHRQIEDLERVVNHLHLLLSEKRNQVSQSLSLRGADVDQVSKAEEAGGESLAVLAQLQHILSAATRGELNSQGAEEGESMVKLSADQLLFFNKNLHQLVVQLTASARTTDEENSRLESELRLARDRLNSLAYCGSEQLLLPLGDESSNVSSMTAVLDREPAYRSSDEYDD